MLTRKMVNMRGVQTWNANRNKSIRKHVLSTVFWILLTGYDENTTSYWALKHYRSNTTYCPTLCWFRLVIIRVLYEVLNPSSRPFTVADSSRLQSRADSQSFDIFMFLRDWSIGPMRVRQASNVEVRISSKGLDYFY